MKNCGLCSGIVGLEGVVKWGILGGDFRWGDIRSHPYGDIRSHAYYEQDSLSDENYLMHQDKFQSIKIPLYRR